MLLAEYSHPRANWLPKTMITFSSGICWLILTTNCSWGKGELQYCYWVFRHESKAMDKLMMVYFPKSHKSATFWAQSVSLSKFLGRRNQKLNLWKANGWEIFGGWTLPRCSQRKSQGHIKLCRIPALGTTNVYYSDLLSRWDTSAWRRLVDWPADRFCEPRNNPPST